MTNGQIIRGPAMPVVSGNKVSSLAFCCYPVLRWSRVESICYELAINVLKGGNLKTSKNSKVALNCRNNAPFQTKQALFPIESAI